GVVVFVGLLVFVGVGDFVGVGLRSRSRADIWSRSSVCRSEGRSDAAGLLLSPSGQNTVPAAIADATATGAAITPSRRVSGRRLTCLGRGDAKAFSPSWYRDLSVTGRQAITFRAKCHRLDHGRCITSAASAPATSAFRSSLEFFRVASRW